MRFPVYLWCFAVFVNIVVQAASTDGINVWTQISSNGPAQRTGATATLYGGNVIVFGGNYVNKTGTKVFLSDTWNFNLATNTWTSLASAPSPRSGHTAVSYNGTTVIFGGMSSSSTYLNDIWQFSSTSNTWSQIVSNGGSTPTARTSHAAALIGNVLWVFGGKNSVGTLLNDLWSFSFATNTWSQITPATSPSARSATSLVPTNSGGFALFGGLGASGALSDTWIFSGSNWVQQNPVFSPGGRSWHVAVPAPKGMIIYGGHTGPTFLGDTWLYTFASNTWTRLISLSGNPAVAPTPRAGQAGVGVPGGLVVFGGTVPHGQAGDTWKFTNGPIIYQLGSGYLSGRALAASASQDSNNVWIFGGLSNSSIALNDLISYNAPTQTFTPLNPSTKPPARYFSAMAPVAGGMILFGGYDGTTVYQDVWAYQTSTSNWALKNAPDFSPTPRFGHSAVQTASNIAAFFGGVSQSAVYYNDLHAYQVGQGWTIIAAINPLPARAFHTSVIISGEIYVFGGMVDGSAGVAPYNDIWVIDLTTLNWRQLALSGAGASPAPRYGHSSVIVPGGFLIYGGFSASDSILNDLWRYDISQDSWSQITDIPTIGRSYAVAGVSSSSVFAFGGTDGTSILNSVDIFNIGGTAYVSTTTGSDISGDGSVGAPFATIAQAVAAVPYGLVSLSSGTYGGFGNTNINPLTVAQITRQGAAAIIDCGNTGFGFTVSSQIPVTFSGLTIQNCNPAVIVNGGEATLSNCVLTGNMGVQGGAVSVINNGILQSVGTTFSSNNGQYGGGLYAEDSSIELINSTFSSNSATESGGAIYIGSNTIFAANMVTVRLNTATIGAGIALVGSSGSIENSTISGNTASSLGGGLYATSGGVVDIGDSISILGSTFDSNSATNGGGAYFVTISTYLGTSQFSNNQAQLGAGVYALKSSNTISNGNFLSNTATQDGGAWYASTSDATFTSPSFDSNSAQRGAAFFSTSGSAIYVTGGDFTNNVASVAGGVSFYESTTAPILVGSSILGNTAPYGLVSATSVTNLTIITAPTGAQNASNILPVIVVDLLDSLNQLATSDNSSFVTASFVSSSPSTILLGTRTQQVVNGVATFNDLYVLSDEGAQVNVTISTANLQAQSTFSFTVSYCQAGQQQINGGCVNCAPGSARSLTDLACSPCSAGYYAPSGSATCSPCAAGTFNGDPGSATCYSCIDGSTSTAGSSSCTPCAIGSFSNQIVGVNTCTPCSPGYNTTIPGSADCLPCPPGTVAPSSGASVCNICFAGSFAPTSGGTSCQTCPAGSFSNDVASACILCPVGSYSSSPGSSTCAACSFNSVASTPGASSCASCPVCTSGTYSNPTDANHCPICTTCSPGTFSQGSSASSCTACPRGSFTSGYGSTSCRLCPASQYAGSPGSVSCTPCPGKSAANQAGSSSCTPCPENTYSANGTICIPCPVGATCAGNTPLDSLPGYFGGPTRYYECFAEDNCVGGNKCAKGYHGPLCSVCSSGYGRLGTTCIRCAGQYIAGAWIVAVIMALYFIFHMLWAGRDIRIAQVGGKPVHPRVTSLKILINHLQILGWLAILKVRWSKDIQLWFYIFSAVPVMNLSNFALDCHTGLTFYSEFFFFMLLPVLIFAVTFLVIFIPYWAMSTSKWQEIIPHAITANLFIFRYIIPILMFQIWQVPDCIQLSSGKYIAQDMRNFCHGDSRDAALGIGIVEFILIVILAPLTALVLIAWHRRELRYNAITNYLAFLWLGFKQHRYYYEFINILKNIILIFFVILLRRYTPLQQLYSVLWLFIIVLVIFLWLQPYEYPLQNFGEFWAIISQFGILITGVIYYDQGQVTGPTYRNVDGLFIALNTIVIIFLIVSIYIIKPLNTKLVSFMDYLAGGAPKNDEEKGKSKTGKVVDPSGIQLGILEDGVSPSSPPKKGFQDTSSAYSGTSLSHSPYSTDEDDDIKRRPSSNSRSSSLVDGRPSRRARSADSRSSEYQRKRRSTSSKSHGYSSSPHSSSSDEAELKRGPTDGDKIALTNKKKKGDNNYKEMNINQLMDSIEQILAPNRKDESAPK